MQVVTKREALAVRRQRERLLSGTRAADDDDDRDPLDSIASESAGPNEQAASRERVARSREALRALKPQELRALTLKAQGYSYAEIGEITGWTYTKINRCMAEGRKRFLAGLRGYRGGPSLRAAVDGPFRAGRRRARRGRGRGRRCAPADLRLLPGQAARLPRDPGPRARVDADRAQPRPVDGRPAPTSGSATASAGRSRRFERERSPLRTAEAGRRARPPPAWRAAFRHRPPRPWRSAASRSQGPAAPYCAVNGVAPDDLIGGGRSSRTADDRQGATRGDPSPGTL